MTPPSILRPAIACGLVLSLAVVTPTSVPLSNDRSLGARAEALLRPLELDASDRSRLADGRIVERHLPSLEPDGRTLAVALAFRVPVEPADWADALADGALYRHDPNVRSWGTIDAAGEPEGWAPAGPVEGWLPEARKLVRFDGGAQANLSRAEARAVRLRLARVEAQGARGDGVRAEAVRAALRDVLARRARAFLDRGTDGIAPYLRADDRTTDLGADLARTETALAPEPPGPPEPFERMFWYEQTVVGRPALSAVHWTLRKTPDRVSIVQREVWVSHTYDGLHADWAVVTEGDGAMVLYVNRTFSERADRFPRWLTHRIGRKRMLEDLRERFAAIREGVAAEAAR